MPGFRKAVIVYEGLPIASGGAHRLRSSNPLTAWSQVRAFLESCTDNPAPEEVPQSSWTTVQPEMVESVLSRMIDDGTLPVPPEVAVNFLWHLRLKDPVTGVVLPHQNPDEYAQPWLLGGPFGMTRIGVGLGAASWVSLNLCLPFEEVSERVIELARAYEAHLPFRLSPRHWSHWQLNQQGTGYYRRKVEVL